MMSEKQLLIENCEFGFTCCLPEEKRTQLREALEIAKKSNDCLIVKGLASTRLDTINKNGRIYPTSVVERAIKEAKPKMEAKMLVCSGDEHPSVESYPRPSTVSHYVTNAYIKNVLIEDDGKKERQNVLFCDICVLPTIPHGVNMQKFITEGVGIGLSIRGLGECDAQGRVTSYEFLGVDLVGLPSSSVYLSTAVNESVEVSAAPLNETFIVSASATNVVHDLQSAQQLIDRIDNTDFGTIKKTSTKMDSEIDPKTGAETTMVTLETETEDEVSDIDQALMLAKKAIMNGQADIDSVTIENVKEEQPKESVENSDVPLNEENRDDDEERYGTCAWCGEELPLSDLKKEKDLGYVCNHCARGLESHEGSLEFEQEDERAEYVPESVLDKSTPEGMVQHIYDHICQMTQESDPIRQQAENIFAKFNNGEMTAIDAKVALGDILAGSNKVYSESCILEAKKEEDPKAGRKFVLKCPAGFVAMDGNALVFKDSPKEALHFIVGKEESGLVHLSGVEKILDTMGVYDVEKYYRKDTTDISAPDEIANNETPVENNDVSTEETKEDQKEGLITGDGAAIATQNCNNQAIKEDNGSNTRFEAQVEIQGQNGNSSETIPVSAVEMEGINNEVGNLYNMKAQKADGPLTIKVTDTQSGEQFMYNPESKMVEPMQAEVEQPLPESAGDLEQDGKKLSMEVDDDNKIEKEFDTPAQAAVAKAGIESGKLGGDVLMSEDNTRPQYQDAPDYGSQNIEPGWYTPVEGMGVVGPYESEEALRADLEHIVQDILGIKVEPMFINQEDIDTYRVAAESAKMDEVMFKNPSEASDPYIVKPLEDAVTNEDFIVDVTRIDWDNKDFIEKFMSNMEPSDPVNTGDMISKIKDLPERINLKMNVAELPDGQMTFDAVKQAVCDKLSKMYVMKVNDVDIQGLHSIH